MEGKLVARTLSPLTWILRNRTSTPPLNPARICPTPITSISKVLATLIKRKIPYLLLTNGGGVTEADKAVALSERFGVSVRPENVQLSHTPMRNLLHEGSASSFFSGGSQREIEDGKAILAVGKPGSAVPVLESYGFGGRLITVDQLHALHPTLYSDIQPSQTAEEVCRRVERRVVPAVFKLILLPILITPFHRF